jgi:uncharacterized protein YabN with tetrapyrrole methylase and pyrophosphatase domain
LAELDEALAAGDRSAAEHELGDVLFSLVSVARKANIDPEAALRGTLERFGQRVRKVETEVAAAGQELSQVSPEQLDLLWEKAKSSP